MADSNTVQPGLATLTGSGWDVFEPSENGKFGAVGVLTAAQVAALQANQTLGTSAVTGYTTGWLPATASAQRFGNQPAGISGTASITIDASNDGITAATTIGTWAFTSADNGAQFYTPPLIIGYPYVRVSVVSDGGGTHTIARGV